MCVCVCVSFEMKFFSNETLKGSSRSPTFWIFQKFNCISTLNRVAKIQLKLSNLKLLSTGEPCTSKYLTLDHSFNQAQNLFYVRLF